MIPKTGRHTSTIWFRWLKRNRPIRSSIQSTTRIYDRLWIFIESGQIERCIDTNERTSYSVSKSQRTAPWTTTETVRAWARDDFETSILKINFKLTIHGVVCGMKESRCCVGYRLRRETKYNNDRMGIVTLTRTSEKWYTSTGGFFFKWRKSLAQWQNRKVNMNILFAMDMTPLVD